MDKAGRHGWFVWVGQGKGARLAGMGPAHQGGSCEYQLCLAATASSSVGVLGPVQAVATTATRCEVWIRDSHCQPGEAVAAHHPTAG